MSQTGQRLSLKSLSIKRLRCRGTKTGRETGDGQESRDGAVDRLRCRGGEWARRRGLRGMCLIVRALTDSLCPKRDKDRASNHSQSKGYAAEGQRRAGDWRWGRRPEAGQRDKDGSGDQTQRETKAARAEELKSGKRPPRRMSGGGEWG